MNAFYFVTMGILLFFSCASSQNAASKREAKEKIEHLKPLLSLTEEQEKSMIEIETSYLQNSKKLKSGRTYQSELKKLKANRKSQVKKVLSRAQYIQWDVVEEKRFRKTPVRAN